MRAFIIRKGTQVIKLTPHSIFRGKCEKMTMRHDMIFTMLTIDPVMIANGRAMNPKYYANHVISHLTRGAEKGWAFFEDEENPMQFIGVRSRNLEVR